MSKSRADGGAALTLGGEDLAAFLAAVVGRGASFRFRARGMSMRPAIQDGDVVTIAPLTRRPRLGDIAAFRNAEGRLVIHRCVGRRRAGVLFKGDAASEVEGPVPPSDVLGVVARIEREGRAVPPKPRVARAAKALRSRADLHHRLDKLAGKTRPAG